MNKLLVCIVACFTVAGAQAVLHTWDGGALTTSFGDADNWNPDGTTYTTADEYVINNGSAVVAGSNFSIQKFTVDGGSALTIANGTTFEANAAISKINTGTLTVDGTLNFKGQRWDLDSGKDAHIVVNGLFQSLGNSFMHPGGDIAIDVNGRLFSKVNQFGSTFGFRSQVINVNAGGVFDLSATLNLRSHSNGGEGAVYLNGGILNFGTASYVTTSLALAGGDDGIIFSDAASVLTLAGHREADVAAWTTAGTLSSTVGDMVVSYDGDLDQTIVAIPEPGVLGLLMLSGGGILFVRRMRM